MYPRRLIREFTGQFMGNICIQTSCRLSAKCRVRLDCPNARTDLNLHVFILSTLGADCEQTAICRFIEAFAIVIVPHKNSSFEAVKFYLNTKYR